METWRHGDLGPSKERKTKPAFVEYALKQCVGPAGSGATYERDLQRSGWHERVNVSDFSSSMLPDHCNFSAHLTDQFRLGSLPSNLASNADMYYSIEGIST